MWLLKNREGNAIVSQFSPSHCFSVAPKPLCEIYVFILDIFLYRNDYSPLYLQIVFLVLRNLPFRIQPNG